MKCICCKSNKSNKTESYCDNCWNYLMPERNQKGITWQDIWTLISYWHATHDESDKDYDFVHDVILVAFSPKYHGL